MRMRMPPTSVARTDVGGGCSGAPQLVVAVSEGLKADVPSLFTAATPGITAIPPYV